MKLGDNLEDEGIRFPACHGRPVSGRFHRSQNGTGSRKIEVGTHGVLGVFVGGQEHTVGISEKRLRIISRPGQLMQIKFICIFCLFFAYL